MQAKPSISLDRLKETVRESAENGDALNEKLSTIELTEWLVGEADPVFLKELGRVLVADFYQRAVRAVRRKPRPTFGQQYSLPQYEHLPRNGRISEKEACSVIEMTYRQVRAAYRRESVRLNDRKRNDPKLAEWKTLMNEMQRRSRKDPGITVGRALGLEKGKQ
jgi:hypothetical protein